MAEDLDDGEFWLPSHFLTDDDILMDFDFKPGQATGTDTVSSNSDLELMSGTTETESDEEDHVLLTELTRKMTRSNLLHDSPSCPVHAKVKGMVLSSSPQSTLCGCVCNQGSSRESLSGPVSPPKEDEKKNNATLDLLNKAAGEVARLKMKTEKTTASTGTGFFDCSQNQKGILYPAPLKNPDHFPPLYFQPQFHHYPPMVWSPSNGLQYNQPKPQNRATKNNNNKSKSNNNNDKNSNATIRPLGLPPSAWPPLQTQAQNQAHVLPNGPIFAGPKKECAGTGVFLPRRVNTPSDTRNKSEGNTPKTKTAKGGSQSQSQSQSNHRRNNRVSASTTAVNNNNNEIQLPQEWTY